MATGTIPITENLYAMIMVLLGDEGLELAEVRELPHCEVDAIRTAIEYGDN
jgi:hypothetical protein